LDERLDPWKSTDAALAKLADNYRQFGDWLLALAAYNSGAGAIRRALTQSKEKTFWALCEAGLVKNETLQYVPKFLAIADIITNAAHFGVSFPDVPHEAPEREVLEVVLYEAESPVIVSKLLGALEIDEALFAYLNPSLLLDISPPRFTFRLPPVDAAKADEAFTAARAENTVTHIVEKGETLWGISRRYGATVAEICDINRINENAILPIGKVLIVPIHK
jgi:membrane-bound lytic murein transglycosylase D